MKLLPGVYIAVKKNNSVYYRSSITYRSKHISLGSFDTEIQAHKAYQEASDLIAYTHYEVEDYWKEVHALSYHKWIILINFRDNQIYIKNPIYLKKNYFIYYIDNCRILKFDVDDLFYYSNHKIMCRGGYLFVSDYGMQLNILSRYGIKNFAVPGRDYRFSNGDNTDYRYGNIEIINKYHGVVKKIKNGTTYYLAKIHVNGDTIIGRYSTEIEAAAAYNKAADILSEKGITKNFPKNYIEDLNDSEYLSLRTKIRISKKIRDWT